MALITCESSNALVMIETPATVFVSNAVDNPDQPKNRMEKNRALQGIFPVATGSELDAVVAVDK